MPTADAPFDRNSSVCQFLLGKKLLWDIEMSLLAAAAAVTPSPSSDVIIAVFRDHSEIQPSL